MKNKSIFKFFLKILLVTMFVLLFTNIVPSFLIMFIRNYKYGSDFLAELFFALMIIIVVLLSKNSYIFTEKREGFFKSFIYGLPILLLSFSMLIVNGLSLDKISIGNCINLILFTFTIGVAEEFLCRGWLQNEFIERFGKNKKEIALSIFLASLIFGGIHITNVFFGQTLFETILQVVQATSAGILLGLIYYKSKNIWTVAFLHGFYDFSIMLSEVNSLKSCTTTSTPTKEMIVFNIFCSVVIILFYLLAIIILIKKVKNETNNNINLKKQRRFNILLWCGMIVIIIFIISPIGTNLNGYDDYYICYDYPEKIINNYETHYSHKDTSINYGPFKFEVFLNKDEKVVIKNINTNEKIVLGSIDVYRYEIVENKNDYIFLIWGYNFSEDIIYYQKINKFNISDSAHFLENIKKSFVEYKVPVIQDIGYLTLDNSKYKYPMLLTELYDKLVITEDGKIELWKSKE